MIDAILSNLTPTILFLLAGFVYLLLAQKLDEAKAVVAHMTVLVIMFGGMGYAVLVAA